MPFAAVRQFRASVCVLGSMVGRCKRARVALPGERKRAIGSRPLVIWRAYGNLGATASSTHYLRAGCAVRSVGVPSVELQRTSMAAVVAENHHHSNRSRTRRRRRTRCWSR